MRWVKGLMLAFVLGVALGLSGCGLLTPHTVSVPDTPSGPETGEVGQQLTFSIEGASCSRGHAVEYSYDWDDGTYSGWSTSTTASKTWGQAGTYEVRAQARCAQDVSVISSWSAGLSVTIEEPAGTPPVATFVFDPPSPTAGLLITFDASASDAPDGVIDEYAWDFGDGTTETGVMVTHAYALPDTYPVLLTVTDNQGQMGTVTQDVTVGAAPEEPTGPLAWGYINLDGAVGNGSPGLSCTWNAGAQLYEISIPATNYHISNYMTLVTPIGSGARTATTSSGGGKLLVLITDAAGATIQSRFHFVTYDEPVIPLAWGYILQDGAVWRGTPGVTCTWTGDWIPHYRITLPGEHYEQQSHITLAAPVGLSAKVITTSSMGGDLIIYVHDGDGSKIPSRFYFVTYDEPGEALAWGHVEADGTAIRSSPGLVCSWNAALERYEVTIPGEHYHFGSYIALVTALGDDAKLVSTGSIGGKLTIYIADQNGDRIQSPFHFVVHEN